MKDCETATIPAPKRAEIQSPVIEFVGAQENVLGIEYSVTNTGDKAGSTEVIITIDIGNTENEDARKTRQLEVGPNSTVTNSLSFRTDVQTSTEAKVCVE